MSQRDPNHFPIVATATSGTQLATKLNDEAIARASNDMGTQRPSYLTAGGIWSENKGGGVYQVMLYDGAADVPVGGAPSGGGGGGIDAFDSAVTYAVGDLVTYQSAIYMCNNGHSGAWTDSNFSQMSLPRPTVADQMLVWNNTSKRWVGNSKIRVTPAGLVAIACTTPTKTVEVGDLADSGNTVQINGRQVDLLLKCGTSGSFLRFHNSSGQTKGTLSYSPSADVVQLTTTGTGLVVNAAGRVGIGTVIPTEALHVNGNIVYTGTIGAASDARLKTNVAEISDATALVQSLRPVTFDMIEEGVPNAGFIAQEAEIALESAPELKDATVKVDVAGMYTMNYMAIIPLLTKALQEALERIEELEKANT